MNHHDPSSSSSTPISHLIRLPPELIDNVLLHVPPHLLQRTALSLLQVFPDYPLSLRHLWTHLIVGRAQQLMPLWRKLKEEGAKVDGGMTKPVKTFAMESWRGDADILNNVLRCLPHIEVLLMNIGTNFAPEHLEEMFEDPRGGIRRMEMHFRPYVEQASYYQFLKGSYFDTSIETMYRKWPEIPSFTQLGIVQDLPPRGTALPTAMPSQATTAVNSVKSSMANSLAKSMADLTLAASSASDSDQASGRSTPPTSVDSGSLPEPKVKGYTGHGPFPYISDKMGYTKPKTFAQPIVFFDIKCIARFGASPVAANLTHLRLRVPSRDLALVLVGPQIQGRANRLFPSLRYLDISTTNVRLDSVLSTLLRTYSRLEHLVLDRVNLFGFTAREKGLELCKNLGGLCVSAGLARGKERERLITAWEVGERTRLALVESQMRRDRERGEEGDDSEGSEGEDEESPDLVAARARQAADEERQRAIAVARSRRGHRSAAHSTFSLRDRPERGQNTASTSLAPSNPLPLPDKFYFVLPPLPTLQSISIGGEAHALSASRVSEWEDEFHAGWRDGLANVLGWATHVAERYERAKRKAEEWYTTELSGASQSSTARRGKGRTAPSLTTRVKPPTDIRLYRFPLPSEPRPTLNPADPTTGLIELEPTARDYLEPYKVAIGDAELYVTSHANPPPCVFCTVPDCEGPARRGADGEKVDGRGGMGIKHQPGCGHLVGRSVWGWEGEL